MDLHPVTWAQYARFASATGHARPQYQMLAPADLQPVVAVTWQEAQDYATWAGAGLPTEAQYERAARGNIEGASYPWGESFAPELANMLAKQGEQPAVRPLTLVTDFPPNGFGLLDICGNAYSWCRDTYDPHWYAVMPDHDPCNTVDGPKRVRRGGCWNFWPEVGRCANRGCLGWEDFTAETRGENTGFRCVQPAD
jgi:formylglycine-generating enzyme required for sulfatase activity